MLTKTFYVYMMTNRDNTVIYAGVTGDLMARVFQHKNKLVKGFTAKYNVIKLVYFEECQDIYSALTREKQIKGGSRQAKINLIKAFNPDWNELLLTEIASSPLRGSSQ